MSLQSRVLNGPFNGLQKKVEFIKRAYFGSLADPRIRGFVEQNTGKGNRAEQGARLFLACKRVLNYLPDPVGVEYTKTPSKMMDEIKYRGYAQGDCDDQSCFVYSCFMTAGIPCKVRVTWYDGSEMPGHIYCVGNIGGQAVPLDTAKIRAAFGIEAPYDRKEDF